MAVFWWPLFPSLHICLVFKDFEWHIGITRHRHINEKTCSIMIFYNCLIYMPRLPCQYEYRNTINWWHFCIQLLSCCRPKFLHKRQRMYWPNLSCRFRYSVGASMEEPGTRWSMVPMCCHIFCILGQQHFLICLLENFSLVDFRPVPLWWSPQF